jgi:hypothetical protein
VVTVILRHRNEYDADQERRGKKAVDHCSNEKSFHRTDAALIDGNRDKPAGGHHQIEFIGLARFLLFRIL